MGAVCAHLGIEVRFVKADDNSSFQSYLLPQSKRYICSHHTVIPAFLDMSHHQVMRFNDVAFPLEHQINEETNTAIQTFKFVTNAELAGSNLKDDKQM